MLLSAPAAVFYLSQMPVDGRRSTRRSDVPAEATSRRAPSSSLSSTRSAHCQG